LPHVIERKSKRGHSGQLRPNKPLHQTGNAIEGITMSRRALLWPTGLALVVGALFLTDWLLWQPGLTEDNVRRIRPGMPLAEVEALLGGPAAETIEMPADYPAYRWQREWRDGRPLSLTVHWISLL
jgi:hypothetical protein